MATLRESYPSHRPEEIIPGWRPEEGLPPTFFGDPEGRTEMEALEEKSAGIRGETEEILGRIKERYTPEQISEAKERLAGRRRPPEGYQIPEFSDAGRERYEQNIFREVEESHGIPGGNPFKINPTEAVDQAMANQWPNRFEQITNLPFAYADELEGKDLKYVNAERLRFKAEVFAKAERKLKYAKAYHTYAMSKYDTERKRVEGRKAQIEKERLRQIQMAPQAKINPKGERTWHEWNENLQDWEDTGKLVKEEKPDKPEYKGGQALKQINSIIKAKATIDKGNMVTDALFTMIAKEDPEAAKEILPFINKKLSGEEKADLEEIWRKRVEYLMPFVPEGSKPKISWLTKLSKTKEVKGRVIVETRTYKGYDLIKYDDGTIVKRKK